MDVTRACIHVATHGAECFSPHVVSDVVTRLTRSGHAVRLSNVSLAPVLKFDLLVDEVHPVRVAASPCEDVATGERWFYAAKGNGAVRFNALRKAKDVVVAVADVDSEPEVPVSTLLTAMPWPDVWAQCGAGHGDDDGWSAEGFVSRLSGGRARATRAQDVDYLSDAAFEDAIRVVLTYTRGVAPSPS